MEVIPISRIDTELVFSVTGSFVTKTRARLGDDSVDSLVFLKKYLMLTRLKNEMFFTFELNKILVKKIVGFVSNLDG